MAIVNMNKISIVGLESQKSQLLKLLMNRGFVQIDDSAFLTEEEDFKGFLTRDSEESQVILYDQKIFQTGQAIDIVKNAVRPKKGLFMPKRLYNNTSSSEAEETYSQDIFEINDIEKKITSIKNNINVLANNKNLLTPWINLDIPLDETETKYTKTILGTIPIAFDVNSIRARLDEEVPESMIGVVNTDKLITYVYVISMKSLFDSTTDVLKEFGFSAVTLTDDKGTPVQIISDYDEKILNLKSELTKAEEKIKSYGVKLDLYENLYDYFTVKRDQKSIVSNLVKTKSAFCLNGWLPRKYVKELISEITEKFDCCVETEEGNREEGFPILLENNSIVTPFESVTNMYSTPGPKDIDPNAIMAFFYIVFFGMMLSDAGYGIIIALACLLIVKKAKMKKGEGNLIKLIGICGVSTAVWGIIFGGIFGDLIPIKAIINPLEDVMVLMGMSLLFGIIHIYVGLGIKAYMLIRDGKVMDAIFDVGFWYLFVTGVCLLIIPIVAGDIGVFSTIGKYLAIVGVIGLVLTQGRSFKGIFMKGFKGVSSLYGITSYFGDILSYSRLMALCLSTGVIGQVINLLGKIAGPIPAIFIGIIGHTINLLINALGAYVHTSRLQYVEFFGKFYEGGGIPFAPFKYKTKFTSINKEEM